MLMDTVDKIQGIVSKYPELNKALKVVVLPKTEDISGDAIIFYVSKEVFSEIEHKYPYIGQVEAHFFEAFIQMPRKGEWIGILTKGTIHKPPKFWTIGNAYLAIQCVEEEHHLK